MASGAPTQIRFSLSGAVVPMAKGTELGGWRPSRPFGGWLATYGTIGIDGKVTPTVDRQGHTFEAAGQALGAIDWTEYLAKGLWNDTHLKDLATWSDGGTTRTFPIVRETSDGVTAENPEDRRQSWDLRHGAFQRTKQRALVGRGGVLEFHDAESPLAKAHGKVGFWTEGHLWDRNDPRSWTAAGEYEPTSLDLDRADHFWTVATMLKGIPRPLGFSADGKMLLSPCETRIIWAKVNEVAVCEVPQNPHAVALPLQLSVPLGSASVLARPCDSCRCPPGARCAPTPAALEKALRGNGAPAANTPAPPVPEDLEENAVGDDDGDAVSRLVAAVVRQFHVSEGTARRWARRYFTRTNTEKAPCP